MDECKETRKMREHFTTGFEEKQKAWGSRVMRQLPEDDPLMIAWKEYKQLPRYGTTRKWALHEKHVDGSLWAAFSAGYIAARQPPESQRKE